MDVVIRIRTSVGNPKRQFVKLPAIPRKGEYVYFRNGFGDLSRTTLRVYDVVYDAGAIGADAINLYCDEVEWNGDLPGDFHV